MFKGILSFSAAAALCAGTFFQPALANEKSDLNVSVSSLMDTQTKLTTLVEKIDPNLPIILQMTFGQAVLFGIDLTKPFGLVGDLTEDGNLAYAGFIPTKNQKMFDAQLAQMRENGKLPENIKIDSKDGYSVLLSNMELNDEIPTFDNSRLLTVKLSPKVLVPLIPLVAEQNKDLDPDKIREQIEQMENVSFSLDINPESDVEVRYVGTPKANTEIAGNFANCEILSASNLCGFYDKNTDFGGQILGTFDENNRRDFTRVLMLNEKFPQELRDTVLLAMDVKKIDIAFSFDSDEKGISGVYAMGIANGKEVNARIEKAIQEMNEKPAEEKVVENSKGQANVRKNKNLNFHEISFDETRILIAIHAKYLFAAVTSDGSDPYQLLVPQLKALKKGEVKQNVTLHYDMNLLKSYFADADFDFAGKFNYAVDYEQGKILAKFKADGGIFQTIGRIKSLLAEKDGDSDMTDELFGDDDAADDESANEMSEDAGEASEEELGEIAD
ncbi:MAG: hypothetical protein IJF17_07170 [Thermoguttaceae bacterium]|nr:hypothetical protein [Thermoguttaceae bacterium]